MLLAALSHRQGPRSDETMTRSVDLIQLALAIEWPPESFLGQDLRYLRFHDVYTTDVGANDLLPLLAQPLTVLDRGIQTWRLASLDCTPD
jgi:hypothetical protein